MKPSPSRTPRVVVIHAAGTIVSIGRHELDWEYMDYGRRAELDELLPRFPGVAAAAGVRSCRRCRRRPIEFGLAR